MALAFVSELHPLSPSVEPSSTKTRLPVTGTASSVGPNKARLAVYLPAIELGLFTLK